MTEVTRRQLLSLSGATLAELNPSLTASAIPGKALYPQTSSELAVGVTPGNYTYPTGNVRRYGAVGDGVADDTAAFSQALTVAITGGLGYVNAPGGQYSVGALTATIPTVSTDPALGTNLNIA